MKGHTNIKSSRIELRASKEAKELIERAAMLSGETVTSYILGRSLTSAKKDIEKMESITLSGQDRDMFFSLLSDPPEPNDDLIKLFK